MSKYRCVVTVPATGVDYGEHFARLAALGVSVDWLETEVNNSKDAELVAKCCRGYDFVIASNETWGEPVLEACRDSLKLLVRYGIGYDMVDVAAANRFGIPVTILPGCNADSVAEQAVALMLAAARGIASQNNVIKKGMVGVKPIPSRNVIGKTVGLLGFGHIGRAAGRMLHGFGCRVLAYDLKPDAGFAKKWNIELVDKETLLRESDIVSVHLPFLPETKWSIDRAAIDIMKDGAIVVNTSRGGLIDSDALAAALESGRLYAAGLDVFENETGSDLPVGHQFLGMDNVVMTPHSASLTPDTFQNMMRCAVDAIEDFLAGKPLPGLLTGK